jgi:c-di-GMP phosphodiesterase
MLDYNVNFLLAAIVLMALILWQYFCTSRPKDLNTRVFLVLAIIATLDVTFELLSTFFIVLQQDGGGFAVMFTTTIFYVFQALLPFSLICYIQSLRENRRNLIKGFVLQSLPTLFLIGVIVTNPITKLLFHFEPVKGYVRGPLYMLMYASAMVHIIVAFLMMLVWRKSLGKQRITSISEILLFTGAGVLIQVFNPHLLMTSFSVSLGILVLFVTINNPYIDTDSLTGLHDKPYLIRKFDELIACETPFHVTVVSLYQMDRVNKVLGLQNGDALLHSVANKLQEMCGTLVYRVSGTRFLVLSLSAADHEQAVQKLHDTFVVNDTSFSAAPSSTSTPLVICDILNANALNNSGTILEYGEYLESIAPRNGSSVLVQSSEETLKQFQYNKEVERFLMTAIEKDLFQIYFQPVYSLKQERYITLEALSRLKHPTLGWIRPDVFIQLAEKRQVIDRISELQFHRICKFVKENEQTLMKRINNIKVNLSPLDLIRTDCGRNFLAIMDEYELSHSYFQFEITETVATEYSVRLLKAIETFKNAGIDLCLDDFGSGYANLNTVMQLPFSVVKLDRSLLTNICTDERTASFYHSIVSALVTMGYKLVSEGVETEDELNLLRGWGLDMIQGFYFSKPLPPDELLLLLNGK